ncbi:MAG: DNA primase, partial [Phycisphaerales bacterium]|nr:DNA primase [Phycisphaerales bacterium]
VGFDNDDIERVLQATDLVRLIAQHVALKQKGREYAGICPFHDDHSPSMMVSPNKQIYKCFSCGAGGDALKFVREYHRMAFREALEFLADRAGVKLTPRRAERVYSTEEMNDGAGVSREDLAMANGSAMEFYRAILKHPEHGKGARAIIEKRGISPEMAERFKLGAAPDRWDGLAMFVASKGFDARAFLGAGLIKNREQGQGAFDLQRNRLIFPIFDQLGRTIAFGGRRINDADEPKYINSTESALFNKSASLYALNFAAAEIRERKTAIIVEGYMDVIACHQAGVTNVVATLGTALTPQSARVLSRLCEKVVLFFDGDDAGQRAADRAVEVFFTSTLEVRIATMAGARAKGLTQAKDPDELVKQPGGVELLKTIIASATEALEYRFLRLRDRLVGASMNQRSNAVNEELRRLHDLGLNDLNPIRRQMVIKRISELAGVSEESVRGAMREFEPRRRAGPGGGRTGEGNADAAQARGEGDERQRAGGGSGGGGGGGEAARPVRGACEHALAFVIAEPSLWLSLSRSQRDALSEGAFDSSGMRALARALAGVPEGATEAVVARALRSVEDDDAEADRTAMTMF